MRTGQTHATTPQQLTLLTVSELPVQFRLDQRTRQLGLAHIAAIRRQLATRHVAAADTATDTATATATGQPTSKAA